MDNVKYKVLATKYCRLFWHEWELNPDNTAYNLLFSYKLSGDLNIEKLNKAVNSFIASTISFRSYFEYDHENDSLEQYIINARPYEIETVDIGNVSEDKIKEIISQKGNEAFDLTQYPLFKFLLFNSNDSRYYFTIIVHHIIADGGAVCKLRDNISDLYNNDSLVLENDERSYLEYLENEQNTESLEKDILDLSFWGDVLDPFELYTDTSNLKLNPFVKKSGEPNIKFNFTRDEEYELIKFAKKNKTSVFTVLSVIWSNLLLKYLRTEGTVISFMFNPRGKKYRNITGSFVNNLLLPVVKNIELSFSEFCNGMNRELKGILKHSKIPFSEIASYMGQKGKIKRDCKSFNLSISESFLARDYKGLSLKSIECEYFFRETAFDIYDLCLEFSKGDEGYVFELHYDRENVSTEVAQQMVEHFKILLLSSIAKPELSPFSHCLLSESEYQKVVNEWNNTEITIDFERNLKGLFEKQVFKTPDNIALIFDDKKVSYRELNRRANRLANTLLKEYKTNFYKDITRDTFIGVYIDRSIDMIVSILAILKTGAAYVPFDVSDPVERTKFKIIDCNCKIILTSKSRIIDLLHIAEIDMLPIGIDSYSDVIDTYPDTNPQIDSIPSDLAYVIYTSGSTGKPKGVMIENRMVINTLEDINSRFDINESDRTIMISNLSFDLSVYDIFGMLICGGCLILPSFEEKNDLTRIIKLMQEFNVTVWNSVPQLFSLVVDYGLSVDFIRNMKCVLLSGDWLDVKLMYKLVEEENCACISSLGGATEGSIWSVFHKIDSVDANAPSIPYGKPLGNQKAYVFDQALNPVPPGVIGEYYIGGAGVARGYLNRPELNSEKFIKNPLQSYCYEDENWSGTMYKTGDLVRWSFDGNLEFIGRNDDQIKVNGFRVELGEIESKLSEHNNINRCIVNVYEKNKSKYLCAFYTGKIEVSKDELISFLLNKLPAHMIPALFVKIESFPLSPTGKLDRKSLRPSETEAVTKSIKHPVDDIQKNICDIWMEILGIDEVGIDDSFFSLGGDSLLAIKTAHRLSKFFQKKILAPDIFQLQTVERIADEYGEETGAIEEGEL